jgi:hypothetical protein
VPAPTGVKLIGATNPLQEDEMRASCILTTLLVCAAAFGADEAKNLAFETKLKRIVVFKEGFGFYFREGSTRLEDGWATTNLTPAAVQGTFWVFPMDKGDKVERLISTADNQIKFKDEADIRSVLADKIGLPLSIKANDQVKQGKLSSLLSNMLLLEDNKNFIALEYDKIQEIKLVGYPLRIKVKTRDQGKATDIGFGYVQEGIQWEPSYLLQVGEGDTAALTMRGTLYNVREDIEGVDVQFVVGAPMLSQRGRIETLLSTFAAPGRAMGEGAFMQNVAQAAERSRVAPAAPPGAAAPEPGIGVAGEGSGELFYYTVHDVSMKSADVASVTIFEHPVGIKPWFEWQADQDEITYVLEVQNRTGLPLTTGPAFVLGTDKPLGQALIKYTPDGATAQLRLARGVGMRTTIRQEEIARGEPYDVRGRRFVKITLRGELELSNYREETARVKILRTVDGRVLEISDDGRVQTTELNQRTTNQKSTLEWWVEVKPGESKTVTYTYEVISSDEV